MTVWAAIIEAKPPNEKHQRFVKYAPAWDRKHAVSRFRRGLVAQGYKEIRMCDLFVIWTPRDS